MLIKNKSLEFLGFPNYSINSDGDVFSNKYKKVLKTFVIDKGYHKVILQHNKLKKTYLIHQLVALAFIPNPNNYDTIDHMDDNPSNNRVGNLQWLPKSDNSKKSWDKGNHDHQKKKVVQMLNGNVVKEYESIQEASRVIGIHFSGISRACKNGWKCAGYEWKLA